MTRPRNVWGRDFNPPPSGSEGLCLWCGRKVAHEYTREIARVPRPQPKRSKCCGVAAESDGGALASWYCGKCGDFVAPGRMDKVVSREKRHEHPGPFGNKYFCTQGCASAFGWELAHLGSRLKKKGG